MGKIPPSLRSAVFPVNRLLNKNPQSIAAGDQQRPDLVTKSPEPHHFLEKTPKKKDSPKSITNTTRRNHSRRSPIITFSSPDISAAKSIIDSIKTTTHSDCRFYNSLLESFIATSPTLDDSISLLRHMVKRHPIFSPDRSTYYILLSHSCKSSDPDPLSSVRKTLSLMDSEGFPPDKGTIDVAIRSLCSAHCLDHAVKLVNEYCVKDLPPDSFTYNYLLKCLCKDRDLGAVNSFITEMRESFSIKPDLFAYTILIDNVCNKKNLREAARLLELLAEDGIQPDVYVYNTIMKGHCMLGQGVEVVRVFKRMIEQGVEPDLVTYNTLIFGLSKSGRVKEAKKYLDVITDTCHFPDAVTYTSLMNGMCREGDALGALQLLGEMEEKGCTPNSCTYNTLLHGLCKAKLLVKAVEFFGVMREAGMKLESGSYGQLLRLLCRSGKVSEAYEVFDYAVESKSLKDVFAYSTLESTLKWLKKAREQGLAV